MANNTIHVAPSINFTETDLTFATRQFGKTSLGVVGETLKGKAFTPTLVNDYSTYKQLFGGLNPCKFANSCYNLKYETSYIAKQFLQESDQLYVTRVLGLSGYDAGDAWTIAFGGAIDVSTIAVTATSTFAATLNYTDGVLTTANFNNSTLQDLYDSGNLTSTTLGGVNVLTGQTVTVGNTFQSNNCENYIGARFNMTCELRDEPFICLTGETVTGANVTTTGTTDTCTVIFDDTTVTTGSTMLIVLTVPTVVINTANSNIITLPASGYITVIGGTITHGAGNTVTMTDCTITLPNGDVLSGGEYKICDVDPANIVYDCDTVGGINYSIVTGTTTGTTTVFTTGLTTTITQIPSGQVTLTFTGIVETLTANPLAAYDNGLVVTLRSTAVYDGSENLTFNVLGDNVSIESVDGNVITPYSDFNLIVNTRQGQTLTYNVSFAKNKANYIGKVFGSFEQCCTNGSPLYIEELYQNQFDTWVNQGFISCIKPTVCLSENLNNYKTQYRGASTPWIVSELKGSKVTRLFKVYTIGDGDASNSDVKITIENILPDAGTFDLCVRAFGDTDARPVYLERFSRLTMAQNSNNYIGRKIGTIDGVYDAKSKYISVEINGECFGGSFPAGFEGYTVRDYACAATPTIQYKKVYNSTDKVRQTFLGFTDSNFDQDMFDFKGLTVFGDDWTGTTQGFHLDKDAASVMIEGTNLNGNFAVGCCEFRNEAGLSGTDYEKVIARKFTLLMAGGFDGWDRHRTGRTNVDGYKSTQTLGQLGFTSGAFDAYADEDGNTVINSDYYAYLKGVKTFRNPKSTRINLLATASIDSFMNSDLIEDSLEMVETERCDLFYVINTPDVNTACSIMTPNDIVGNIDGLYDSSYAATYSYFGQYNDEENNVYLFLPPTAEVMRLFAYTDKVSAPWYATGGVKHGITKFRKVRKTLTQGEMDVLYAGRINPLSTESGYGVCLWGNKTLQVSDTALTSINVRRMIIYTQRLLADASISLLFAPNDNKVRRDFANIINPILANVKDQRGITDFKIEIDNSADTIDRNELKGRILIKPTRAVEYIDINFTLTNTGASFENI